MLAICILTGVVFITMCIEEGFWNGLIAGIFTCGACVIIVIIFSAGFNTAEFPYESYELYKTYEPIPIEDKYVLNSPDSECNIIYTKNELGELEEVKLLGKHNFLFTQEKPKVLVYKRDLKPLAKLLLFNFSLEKNVYYVPVQSIFY